MEPELLQPPSPGIFVWFSLICSRGEGGSTAAAVTLHTVADESRKMADGVARSPSRLCSRDGKICCYGDALSTIFLLACFRAVLPTFRFSFFFSFIIFFPCVPVCLSSSCPFVCAAAICYSQKVRIFLLVSFVPYPISDFFCFFIRLVNFFVAPISRVAFFVVVLSYPVS